MTETGNVVAGNSASDHQVRPPPLHPAPQGTSDTWKTIREHPAVIGTLLMFCCFPAGLALVWTHSVWSMRTKIFWTVGWISLMGIIGVAVAKQEAATRKLLTEANTSWESGQQAEAVAKYKGILEDYASTIDQEQLPVIYRRIIDFDAEHGKTDESRAFIRKALRDHVAIKLETPSALALLAQEKPIESKAPAPDDKPTISDAKPTTPDKSVVAVAGAEPDQSKWRAAESWGTSTRVKAFKKIVKKYQDMPDKYASDRTVEEFNKELAALQQEFLAIPFNGSYQSIDARTMIELWEEEMEGKYKGHLYNVLEAEVRNIYIQYKARVH